jgi:peptidoglycan/xylan/chitin deacetylase (PgdA/CDA1 family)
MGKLKNIFSKIIFFSGLPLLLRETILKNKVTVILLHDPSPAKADKLLSWLTKNYNAVSLRDFVDFRNNKRKLPPKSLIVTFDDGHAGNYQLLPIFRKYNVKPVIFLCAGIAGTNRHFWFKYKGLKTGSDPLKVISEQERLKKLSEAGFSREKEFDSAQSLSASEIMEMKDFVDFQSHTIFHPVLPMCTDEESENEICRSKEILQNSFGLDIYALAFPNGNYTSRETGFAEKAGYVCTLTTEQGFIDKNSDMYRLKRINLNDNDSIAVVSLKITGIWNLLKSRSRSLPLPLY